MRIGIDVRLLSKPLTGIGRYTAELTRNLVNKPGEFSLYSPNTLAIKQWQKNNVQVRSFNFHGKFLGMFWSQTYLPLWAAKDHVDIFWSPTHRLPYFLPKRAAQVVTVHDLVWKHAGETMPPLNRLIERKLMPAAIKQADRIIADSFNTAHDLEEEYPGISDKIRVIYPGVTELPAPLDIKSLSSLGVESPYFLFVGTLEPRKNLLRLLQAYASLDTKIKDQNRLVIVGAKGWGSIAVVSWIKELGLNGKVIIAGYVNDTQLSTLYTYARFLVMPSLYEGFGLPLVEAMSFGTPVLTSDRSSLPEIAGDAGLLVDPLDLTSIAKGLSTLLCNNALRESLAEKAIANAKQFSWQSAAQKLWDIFQELVDIKANKR